MMRDDKRFFEAEPEQVFAPAILHIDIGCEVELPVPDLMSHDFARCDDGFGPGGNDVGQILTLHIAGEAAAVTKVKEEARHRA